jgi:hypothetical protein
MTRFSLGSINIPRLTALRHANKQQIAVRLIPYETETYEDQI